MKRKVTTIQKKGFEKSLELPFYPSAPGKTILSQLFPRQIPAPIIWKNLFCERKTKWDSKICSL